MKNFTKTFRIIALAVIGLSTATVITACASTGGSSSSAQKSNKTSRQTAANTTVQKENNTSVQPSANEAVQKSITITGIPSNYKDMIVGFYLAPTANLQSTVALSSGIINGSSVTFNMEDRKTNNPWRGNGDFIFYITIWENLQALEDDQRGYEGNTAGLTKVTQPTTTVQWSQFKILKLTSGDYQLAGNNSGGVTITKYTGKATNVVIPATIEGNKVTEIGEGAFYKNKSITSVTIPDGVTSIMGGRNTGAFEGCESLTSVTIPNSVVSIGEEAFSGSGLTSITIPNSVKSIGMLAFAWCSSLSSVTIGNGITSIEDGTFAGTGLTSITIGNGVKKIGMSAFEQCTNLTSVTFQGTIPSDKFTSEFMGMGAVFPGDLRAKFYATDSRNGTPGTYKTTAPVNDNSRWTRQ